MSDEANYEIRLTGDRMFSYSVHKLDEIGGRYPWSEVVGVTVTLYGARRKARRHARRFGRMTVERLELYPECPPSIPEPQSLRA